MRLMRWEPELDIQEVVERMNQLFGRRFPGSSEGAWTLPVDVVQEGNNLTVKASVPGVKAEDLDISIEGNTLVIKGESASDTEETKEGWYVRERRHGSFFRSLALPAEVDESRASVTLKDGELTITAPVAESPTRRKLTITSGN